MRCFEIRPWFNDQGLIAHAQPGLFIQEGAVDIVRNQQRLGRGYPGTHGMQNRLNFKLVKKNNMKWNVAPGPPKSKRCPIPR
jgi:hypothetical protein